MGYAQLQLDTTAAKTIFGTYGHRAYKYRTGRRIQNLSFMPRIIVLKYQKDMSKHFFLVKKHYMSTNDYDTPILSVFGPKLRHTSRTTRKVGYIHKNIIGFIP